jgi:arginyl-tRNA--protein-N-Asp/Glu arginylyltransferase
VVEWWGSGVKSAEDLSVTSPPNHTAAPPQSLSHYPALPPPVKVHLVTLGQHPCSYLPGQVATSRALLAEQMPPELYHRFMDAGFRRSGRLLYQPVCAGCRECRPVRVPVDRFRPGKSQRRVWRRNADLVVSVEDAEPTDEKFDLYRRYVVGRHGGAEADEDRQGFDDFLYDSPVETIEFTYRDESGRLLAVGVCDVCAESLSSVYFYFEPTELRRGLGTYGALREIEAARRLGIPYYYLGYWIEGCGAMRYKTEFRPNELLCPDGLWRPNAPH